MSVFVFSCGGRYGRNHAELLIEKNKDLVILHAADSFEVYRGVYHVYTMIKNNTDKKKDIVQVTAKYYNEEGKELAQSISVLRRMLKAGDSAIVDNQYIFPTIDDLVYKVKISASYGLK